MGAEEHDLETLDSICRRVLWLAVRMVDAANHDRPGDAGGVKVGGHQASSASMASIMTALYFSHLRRGDRVAVKPHGSPVFHAVQYLLGNLDRSYLPRLRELGGLQAYPSRTKDPDGVDFSTGSVGLGVAATLFAAATRRYLDHHASPGPAGSGERTAGRVPRYVAVLGDAELDEGNVWEAIADPAVQGLGNVLWVVDLNRQSLDRVVPGIRAHRLERFFEDCGWHVVEAKYGRRLQAAFAGGPAGEALRRHIDEMSNEEYQALFGHRGTDLRERFCAHADPLVAKLLADVPDAEVAALVLDLGGHDLAELLGAFAAADAVTDRPTVVFAYTVKGWGLPLAGDPLNHAALLSVAQVDELRRDLGLTGDDEWDRFPSESAEGRRCAQAAAELGSPGNGPRPRVRVPGGVGRGWGRTTSTQEAFGRLLVRLADEPLLGDLLVTASPDVSVSTNLGGWINKVGVFGPEHAADYLGEGRLLRWLPGPDGQHIELGISEMNLFLLLSQLGLAWEMHGRNLLPVGTLYDPFVARGLDAFVYAVYAGARFVLVGTPSGVTLAPEGGAHQSSITASIGLELPGVTLAEPAYAGALDWLLCDGLDALTRPDGSALYLRLSTRPIDQAPFEAVRDRIGDEALRAAVLAGGYRLVEPSPALARDAPAVTLAASGPVVPEAVAAAGLLAEEGVAATVLDVTSLDRLYHGWRAALSRAARAATRPSETFHLATLLRAATPAAPIITVHDASSHAMAWLGSVFGTPVVPVGVDDFGQSGTIEELYRTFDLLPEQLANAALVALARSR